MLTKEEILHGSPIIARYMGAKVEQSYSDVEDISGLMFYWNKENEKSSPSKTDRSLPLSGLNYHCSWNALMPVYLKVNKEIQERSEIDIRFSNDTSDMVLDMWNNFEDGECNIHTLYKILVQYITYYNSLS